MSSPLSKPPFVGSTGNYGRNGVYLHPSSHFCCRDAGVTQNLIERAVILAEGDRIDIAHLFTSGESITSPLYSPGPNGKLTKRGVVELPLARSEWHGNPTVDQIAAAVFGQSDASAPLHLLQFEDELVAQLIHRALAKANGNVSAAARMLGMNRYQLEYRLKRSSGD
ncbi:MAG: Fis family transcriptional regulator [Gammaproteobacteria bacterium]|jgi:two-component system response regulator HydG|nr:Fis family transcriptional regulator [Gammaproteobacteria bacterium]